MGGFPECCEAGFAWRLGFGECGGHGVFARYDAEIIQLDRVRCHAGSAGIGVGRKRL